MKASWKIYLIGIFCLFAFVFFLTKKSNVASSNEVSEESFEQSQNTASRDIASEKKAGRDDGKAVPAPSTPLAMGVGRPKNLEDFLKALDPNGERFVSRADDGRVTQISRLSIKGQSETPEKMQEFAKTIAEYAGTPGDQVVASQTVLDDTMYSKGQQFDQEYDGYEVFGGYMKVFTRTSDGAIYFVANEFKDVGDVDLRLKYGFEEAKAIALGKYVNKDGVKVLNQASKPVIYNIRAGSSELAWEIQVQIQGPLYDRRHLLVSATTGMILQDISMLKN